MAWWLILLIGAVLGLIVVGVGIASVRSKLPRLRRAQVALGEHQKAALRVQERMEKLGEDAQDLQAKLPQRSAAAGHSGTIQ
ncbi:MAG TPA: hypothetical protein H9902_14535 [Candidatus Stackebrandtia faecavium]|nr:hypothetical protein [Candidatus Stackebrandtia faecavium]